MSELLQSDYFLYPIYLAIKAAYLPAMWLDQHTGFVHVLRVFLCALAIALINGLELSKRKRWALNIAVLMLGLFSAVTLFIYVAPILLALHKRVKGLKLGVIFTLNSLVIWAALYGMRLIKGLVFSCLPFMALVLMRAKIPAPRPLAFGVIITAMIELALMNAPWLYEMGGAWLLAKLPGMQPEIRWVKELPKGEKYGFSTINNLYLDGKIHKIAIVIYDKKSVDDKILEQMHKSAKLPEQMTLYGYLFPYFELNFNNLHLNDLLIKNNFNYHYCKEYFHSKLQYEINLNITENLDGITKETK